MMAERYKDGQTPNTNHTETVSFKTQNTIEIIEVYSHNDKIRIFFKKNNLLADFELESIKKPEILHYFPELSSYFK